MATKTQSIVQAVIDKLADKLPALLDAQSLPHPSSEILPDGSRIGYRYGKPHFEMAAGDPIVWVQTRRSTMNEFVLGRTSVRAFERQYQFLVGIFVAGSDEHVTQKQIDQYSDCLIAALEDAPTFGVTSVVNSWVSRDENTGPVEDESGLFAVAAVELVLQLRRTAKAV